MIASLTKKCLNAILQFFICLVNDSGLIPWFVQTHGMIPHWTIQGIFPLAGF
jgi:hypothetical protein